MKVELQLENGIDKLLRRKTKLKWRVEELSGEIMNYSDYNSDLITENFKIF
jgi:hypothetical protein